MSQNNRSFSQAEEAVLTTVAYSDIFAFPLTHDEIWHFLISTQPISKTAFETALQSLSDLVLFSNSFYCLLGREALIQERQKNMPEVGKKLRLAQQIIPRLTWIPTVQFIGLSGGLAVSNASVKDDIDLFVVVRKNTIFFSRFMLLLLLQFMGRRRKRGSGSAPDKFCVNFLVDETQMSWPKDQQNVYTAREIAQVIPMFVRGTTYTTFMEKNRWIKDFLPNVSAEKRKPFLQKKAVRKIFFSQFLERFLRFIQISYMKKAHTTEVITNHYLAFHPYDYRSKTIQKLRMKMQSLGLLTKF